MHVNLSLFGIFISRETGKTFFPCKCLHLHEVYFDALPPTQFPPLLDLSSSKCYILISKPKCACKIHNIYQ